MTYLWPGHLWLLLALPLLPLLYVWLLRRRGKTALRYSSLDVVRQASGGPGGGTCRRRSSSWPAPCCCSPPRGPPRR